MLIGQYNKSLILSYLGIICSVLGMYFAFTVDYKYAMICMVIAGLCDTFDGKFARMCKRSKDAEMFGIQLDSLADTVDFVIFPVVFGLALGFNEWYHVISYILIAMAGVQRLCHFNVLVINKNDKGPVKYYSGLPVTSTSIIVPFFWLVFSYINNYDAYSLTYFIVTTAVAILFVLNIKVPKPRGKAYPVIGIIALVGLILLGLR
jgi:CDP-diacylglycerol--serine O-phosphatidyltransferase